MCGSVRVGGKKPKSMWWNDEANLGLRERRMIVRRCKGLEMRLQTKDVRKFTKKKSKRLKCVYQSKERLMNSLEGR